ncbi:hypothetical protein QBC40DRAFT_327960 [Triangularia verruculosa]|uniref:Uncharacterized protein n=1 Tax=Triangularia verruculosa TaxID=2587418 RepID=A0AAN7AUK6_9PEZI|nr:hypothetical protein QBC40DRAFT_327960 [Triangularia verruculosa]
MMAALCSSRILLVSYSLVMLTVSCDGVMGWKKIIYLAMGSVVSACDGLVGEIIGTSNDGAGDAVGAACVASDLYENRDAVKCSWSNCYTTMITYHTPPATNYNLDYSYNAFNIVPSVLYGIGIKYNTDGAVTTTRGASFNPNNAEGQVALSPTTIAGTVVGLGSTYSFSAQSSCPANNLQVTSYVSTKNSVTNGRGLTKRLHREQKYNSPKCFNVPSNQPSHNGYSCPLQTQLSTGFCLNLRAKGTPHTNGLNLGYSGGGNPNASPKNAGSVWHLSCNGTLKAFTNQGIPPLDGLMGQGYFFTIGTRS